MKLINGFISRSAKLMVFMVLLALLPQTSHQNMGKKGCSAATTETSINTIRILNEYHCSG